MAQGRGDADSVRTAVVGGGLVGALQACFLAKRGFHVDLYEGREDIRTLEVVKGRSINLALSIRGRAALKHIGIEEEVTSKGIPMRARRIHRRDGVLQNHPYDKDGQYILSVDRRKLNETLLTEAEKHPNVTIHFSHKLVRADVNSGELEFMNTATGKTVKHTQGVVFGTDGAYSTMRRQMMRSGRIDYSQEYIPHGYMELFIPPAEDGGFAMLPNYLHIWPRDEFMMIALPNQDHTFTVTLFMPFPTFEDLHSKGEVGVLAFFQEHFSDAIPVIGEKNLQDIFMSSKGLPMVTVKCSPYHHKDKAVLMGDAAHAMVPFYGQGMNCGFEDCIVFDEILDKNNNNFEAALAEYSSIRSPDCQAICDLARYNYVEMRHHVNSRLFLLNKKLDNFLYWLFPSWYMPLYNMVTFSRIRYSVVINKWKRQKQIVRVGLFSALFGLAVFTGFGAGNRFLLPPQRRFHFFPGRGINWGRFRGHWDHLRERENFWNPRAQIS